MMLYHNIKNSDDKRKVKQVVHKQEHNQFKITFCQKGQTITKDLLTDISDGTWTSKPKWKKKLKGKHERRHAGKNTMLYNTEWQMGKEKIYTTKVKVIP